MQRRPRFLIGVAVAVLLAGGAVAFFARRAPEIAPIVPIRPVSFERSLVRQGAALAALGGCATCHTAAGGEPYAGGRGLATPFGTIFSTNITPDPEDGIGKWSQAAFARALRKGISRSGWHLYPAFPYDHFTRLEENDIAALYAFIMTRLPASAPRPKNHLPFPFRVRALLGAWNLFFLRTRPLPPDPAQSAEWNRGRYLVAGIGHCGACHTPRNLLGAETASHVLAGGEAEGWDAPALQPAALLPQPWSKAELFQYLRTGLAPRHEGAAGPMLEVVRDLAGASDRDLWAIALYLGVPAAAPLPPQPSAPAALAGRAQAAAQEAPAGARFFAGACAGCHGRGTPGGLPSLAFSTTLAAQSPRNAIHILREGIPLRDEEPGYAMPGFADALTDRQMAELLRYLRARFADRPMWNLARPLQQ